MIEWLHPGLVLILGAFLVPLFRGTAKKAYLLALAVIALGDCLWMSVGQYGVIRFLDYTLVFGRVDKLSLAFSYVFTIMAVIGVTYSLHVEEDGQHVAALTYAGSALGAVFAGDFLTLFLFWELMAFSSVFLIWFRRNKEAVAAGYRYFLVHAFGGVCLLGGIVLYYNQTGTLAFGSLAGQAGSAAFYLILIGFMLNAAVFPLSAWMPDAYPEATVTGAVFLSAFTSKTAVYTLIRGFPGTHVLIYFGVVMALYGTIYAILENDSRRLLAYSIIAQIGYMVVGIGIGTELALNGAVAHAFTHILYKGLLFMAAGAVLQMAGSSKLYKLGGLSKSMPLTFILYMVGALSISAVPLFSGFVSKAMILSSTGEAHLPWAFLALTTASVGTFIHTGLKLPWLMFFGKEQGIEAGEPTGNMLAGMGMAALACVIIGVFYKSLYSVLPYHVEYHPYSLHHVVTSAEMLLFAVAGFLLLAKYLEARQTITLDTDWFYRKGGRAFVWLTENPIAAIEFNVITQAYKAVLGPVMKLAPVMGRFDLKVIDGAVNGVAQVVMSWGRGVRSLQSGQLQRYALVMFLGVLVMLSAILIFFKA